MPTYTYQCENCGIRFDQYQKFTDEPLVVCPECGEPALRKVFQPVGIVFKGKGFYATDNRSPSGQTFSSESHDHGKKESTQRRQSPPFTYSGCQIGSLFCSPAEYFLQRSNRIKTIPTPVCAIILLPSKF